MKILIIVMVLTILLLMLVYSTGAQPPLPTQVPSFITTGTPTYLPTFDYPTANPARFATVAAQTQAATIVEPELPNAQVPLFVIPALDVPTFLIQPLQQVSQAICFVIAALDR